MKGAARGKHGSPKRQAPPTAPHACTEKARAAAFLRLKPNIYLWPPDLSEYPFSSSHAMGKLSEPAVTNKFKSVFAKLKGRRRAESSKAKMTAATAVTCVNDASEVESPVDILTADLHDMDITASPNLPIAPSGTFDFRPPASCPRWPGPKYDDLIQVIPGIFNVSRDMKLPKTKTKQKRAEVKRRPSHDDRHAIRRHNRKLTTTPSAQTKKKHHQTMPKRPQFLPPPPSRPEPLHLLTLPGELRNQIYRYLYLSKEPLQAQFRPILSPHQGTAKPSIRRFPREPTLALVCRQLRDEACSFFYAENSFVFAASTGKSCNADLYPMTATKQMARWMSASSATAALTRMELRLGDPGANGLYGRQRVTYVLRRLADGKTDVEVEVGEAARCVCWEKEAVMDGVREETAKRESGGGNLVQDAMVLVAKRNAALEGDVQELDWQNCAECGKSAWRRVDERAM